MKTTYTTFSFSNFWRYFRKMPNFSLLSPLREVHPLYVLLYFQISNGIIAMYKGSIWSTVHVLDILVLPFSPLL